MRNRKTIAFGRKGVSGRLAVGSDAGTEREPRRPVMSAAKLIYGSGALVVDVTLRDLSENGARVVAARPLPTIDALSVAFDGTTRPASVVWRRDGALGLRFTGPPKRT